MPACYSGITYQPRLRSFSSGYKVLFMKDSFEAFNLVYRTPLNSPTFARSYSNRQIQCLRTRDSTKRPALSLLQIRYRPLQPCHNSQIPASKHGKPSRIWRYDAKLDRIRLATAAQLSFTAVILSTLIPFVALIIWIARRKVDGSSFSSFFDTFAGEHVGGRLTQPQAKAIDVVAGAILVPLAAAGFNFVLFNSARVSVVSERGKKTYTSAIVGRSQLF